MVIAIIAILAAMLLPALAKAKERAIRIQCLNNVKQLEIATFIYTGDNRDKLPDCSGFNWAWDMPWAAGDLMLDSGVSKKTFYCPGTKSRFDDTLNFGNTTSGQSLWYYSVNSYHVMGYVVARRFGRQAYARIFGTCFAVTMLGTMTGPILMAAIFDRTGSYDLGLMLFPLLPVLALGLLCLARFSPQRTKAA